MKKESVVGLGIRHKPTHGANDVASCRLHRRVGLVVGQNDHILALIPIALNEEARDVVNIVDAAAKLAFLAKVVDTDEQSLAPAGTVGVLESIAFGSSMAELLRRRRRRRTGAGMGGVAVTP